MYHVNSIQVHVGYNKTWVQMFMPLPVSIEYTYNTCFVDLKYAMYLGHEKEFCSTTRETFSTVVQALKTLRKEVE